MESEKPARKSKYLRILQILFIPLIVAIGFALIQAGYDWRQVVTEQGPLGYGVYFIFVCIMPLIGFPISAFYIFSGIAFPPLLGLALTSAGLLVNMVLGYWIGAVFLQQPVSHYLKKTRFNPELMGERNLTRLTILVRSVPGVPYWMQNYLLALSKVPFWTYLAFSWLIQSLYCAGTIFLTSSGMNIKDPTSALIFVLVGVLFFFSIWYSRKKLMKTPASDIDSKAS